MLIVDSSLPLYPDIDGHEGGPDMAAGADGPATGAIDESEDDWPFLVKLVLVGVVVAVYAGWLRFSRSQHPDMAGFKKSRV